MSKKTYQKNIENLAKILSDDNDKYGINYKETLYNSTKGDFFLCFCCRCGLSPISIECATCAYVYHFCKKCIGYESILIGFNQCIFCKRMQNDKILKLLGKSTYKLKDDFYGNKAINSCL